MCTDDEIIRDIQRVAAQLNVGQLSFAEYIALGGQFEEEIKEDDCNTFSSFCELAGIKECAFE